MFCFNKLSRFLSGILFKFLGKINLKLIGFDGTFKNLNQYGNHKFWDNMFFLSLGPFIDRLSMGKHDAPMSQYRLVLLHIIAG